MKTPRGLLSLMAAAALTWWVFLLASCGGSGNGSAPVIAPVVTSVAISAQATTITSGELDTFTITVSGTGNYIARPCSGR
jgi:hypothetical protein